MSLCFGIIGEPKLLGRQMLVEVLSDILQAFFITIADELYYYDIQLTINLLKIFIIKRIQLLSSNLKFCNFNSKFCNTNFRY